MKNTRKIPAFLAAVLALAGCGGEEVPEARTEGAFASALAEVENLGDCDSLAGNITTLEVTDVGLCDDGGEMQILVTAFYDCPDGRSLHWNDWGWGYSDGDWQAHDRADGQLVPPQADLDGCQP